VATTDALVIVTKIQAEWTKRRATSDEWHRIRAELQRFPNLAQLRDELISCKDPTYNSSLSEEEKHKVMQALPYETVEEINKRIVVEGHKIRNNLRDLEFFAADINSGDLDLRTFARMSGTLFVRRFRQVRPYIDIRRQNWSATYEQISELYNRLQGINLEGGEADGSL
jgi:hypothetical protein